MSRQSKFEQMLECLINEDREKAEELFHDIVVASAKEIYENILDDEYYEEVGGDESDDFLNDVEDEDHKDEFDSDTVGSEEGDDDDEFNFDDDDEVSQDDITDIKDAIEDLKAEFEKLLHGDHDNFDDDDSEEFGSEEGDNFNFDNDAEDGDEDGEQKESFVREYVEKVGMDWDKSSSMDSEQNVTSKRSPVAGKNDMGGSAKNIAQGGKGTETGTKGGLLDPAAKDLNSRNVNVPGSKNATKLTNVPKGHGAEKKGAGETGANTTSLFRGRQSR